jgi:cholesterol transport system auxiliary component
MKNRALNPYFVFRKTIFSSNISWLCAALMLSACTVLDKPVQATLYDFGPGSMITPARPAPTARAVMLAEVDAPTALDNTAVMYRLAYADDQQLRPYSQARWSMPPAQLVRLRVREHLGQGGVVLNASDGAALGRTSAGWPLLLRLELEEFSQRFDHPQTSIGLVKLRAVLIETTAGTDKLLGQRVWVTQRPAATGDAPGGVRALTAATDALAAELSEWLNTWRR